MDYKEYCVEERILLLAKNYADNNNVDYISYAIVPPDWIIQLKEALGSKIQTNNEGNIIIYFCRYPRIMQAREMIIIPDKYGIGKITFLSDFQ